MGLGNSTSRENLRDLIVQPFPKVSLQNQSLIKKNVAQVKCIGEQKFNQASLPRVFSEALTSLEAYTYGTTIS